MTVEDMDQAIKKSTTIEFLPARTLIFPPAWQRYDEAVIALRLGATSEASAVLSSVMRW
jgi:hypothetical protein